MLDEIWVLFDGFNEGFYRNIKLDPGGLLELD
jgi:hypothetical protein